MKKEKKSRNLLQAANFIFALLLMYFIFFGFISLAWNKTPGNYLLFVYKNFFANYTQFTYDHAWQNVFYYPSWVSLVIFLLIGFIQSYRENFLVYSIKNNFWLIPFMLIFSWIWYSMNYQLSIFYVISLYFSSIDGYLNFLILEVLYCGIGFVGGYF